MRGCRGCVVVGGWHVCWGDMCGEGVHGEGSVHGCGGMWLWGQHMWLQWGMRGCRRHAGLRGAWLWEGGMVAGGHVWDTMRYGQ